MRILGACNQYTVRSLQLTAEISYCKGRIVFHIGIKERQVPYAHIENDFNIPRNKMSGSSQKCAI